MKRPFIIIAALWVGYTPAASQEAATDLSQTLMAHSEEMQTHLNDASDALQDTHAKLHQLNTQLATDTDTLSDAERQDLQEQSDTLTTQSQQQMQHLQSVLNQYSTTMETTSNVIAGIASTEQGVVSNIR